MESNKTIIDIYSKGGYPANVLSNFYSNRFIVDGVECASMEGFLQSLKYSNAKKQRTVCLKSGIEAKNAGKNKWLWKLTGVVYWQGQKLKRQGAGFTRLLNKAYSELAKTETFAAALNAADGAILTHSVGKSNPRKTILTEREFIIQLNRLRENGLFP